MDKLKLKLSQVGKFLNDLPGSVAIPSTALVTYVFTYKVNQASANRTLRYLFKLQNEEMEFVRKFLIEHNLIDAFNSALLVRYQQRPMDIKKFMKI